MGLHTPTEEQEKAFKSVIRAINKAKKTGLVFYSKQWSLVAYRKEANDYAQQFDFEKLFGKSSATIEFLSESVLFDSGADDYPQYFTKEDEEKYTAEEDY
jgi:hypothetical protein